VGTKVLFPACGSLEVPLFDPYHPRSRVFRSGRGDLDFSGPLPRPERDTQRFVWCSFMRFPFSLSLKVLSTAFSVLTYSSLFPHSSYRSS